MTFDNYKYARSLIILLNDRIQHMSIEILLNYTGKYLVLKNMDRSFDYNTEFLWYFYHRQQICRFLKYIKEPPVLKQEKFFNLYSKNNLSFEFLLLSSPHFNFNFKFLKS